MKYYPALAVPADIYVWPLQAVQLKAWKYYHTPGIPADIYFFPLKSGAADRYEIFPHFYRAANIMWPAPSSPADSLKYYPASGMQLMYMWARYKHCS